jgi:hypothetical protein
MLAIVEDTFEQPAGILNLRLIEEPWSIAILVKQRGAIPIDDRFKMAITCAPDIIHPSTIPLMDMPEVNASTIIFLVSVHHRIPLAITNLRNKPSEDLAGVIWIADAVVISKSKGGEHIIRTDGAPVYVTRVIDLAPSLNARK